MDNRLLTARKILIIGESGRGKTTFAHKLSEKLQLPLHSTDDFYWKVKFTEPNDRQSSIQNIEKVYATNAWVMEGSSTHLFKPGLDKADVVINLVFRNVFEQWWSLIKRNRARKDEDLFKHLSYVTRKRFGIRNDKEKKKRELLQPYSNKILTIKSYKELDRLFRNF